MPCTTGIYTELLHTSVSLALSLYTYDLPSTARNSGVIIERDALCLYIYSIYTAFRALCSLSLSLYVSGIQFDDNPPCITTLLPYSVCALLYSIAAQYMRETEALYIDCGMIILSRDISLYTPLVLARSKNEAFSEISRYE